MPELVILLVLYALRGFTSGAWWSRAAAGMPRAVIAHPMADTNFDRTRCEATLADAGIRTAMPGLKGENPRPDKRVMKPCAPGDSRHDA